MSAHAAVRLKPVHGTKVMIAAGTKVADGEPYTLVDGSLVIPPEKLRWFGNGDERRGRQELRFLIEAEHDRDVRLGPTVQPANVRIAGPADEQAVFDLLMLDVNENAKRIAMPDPERIMMVIQMATQQKGTIIGVIDGPDHKTPVAVTILAPMQWWWSREWFYQEVVSYVHTDYRKTRYAHDLIAFQRSMGDRLSESYGHRIYIMMGILGLKRVREKAIMVRRKMRQVGMAFLYPCPYGDDEGMT